MANRNVYTPEGFSAMTWDLTRAAIDRSTKDVVFATGEGRCFHG